MFSFAFIMSTHNRQLHWFKLTIFGKPELILFVSNNQRLSWGMFSSNKKYNLTPEWENYCLLMNYHKVWSIVLTLNLLRENKNKMKMNDFLMVWARLCHGSDPIEHWREVTLRNRKRWGYYWTPIECWTQKVCYPKSICY